MKASGAGGRSRAGARRGDNGSVERHGRREWRSYRDDAAHGRPPQRPPGAGRWPGLQLSSQKFSFLLLFKPKITNGMPVGCSEGAKRLLPRCLGQRPKNGLWSPL